MNLLFTGRGGAGSWEVRGRQLGAACGAVVQEKASTAMCKEADIVVVVKRVTPDMLASLRFARRTWVFDAVDFYPQPLCGEWSREESIRWVKKQIKVLSPSAVIWPTQRMMDDCGDGRPGLVLPHHHRPGIAPNPVREQVRLVGYEGRSVYLGGWEAVIHRECLRRGWKFTSTPASLADLDIVVALRGDQWSSYAATHWKSNVKLANAHASGTPFVGNAECGYKETATGCELWAETGNDLAKAFDMLSSASEREQISDRFRQRAYSVEQAADDLGAFLRGL